MEVIRLLPSTEADDLLALTREIATDGLAPRVALAEEEARFPREELRTLGRAGLLSLPFDEEMGGGGQPYEVYLQVLEELSRAWLAVGISVSVHALACFPMATAGTAASDATKVGPSTTRRRVPRNWTSTRPQPIDALAPSR